MSNTGGLIANPLRLPEAFDSIIVGGEYLPGLARVGKPSRKFKWDKKEGPGTQGDTLTYRGSRLVDFVIELVMWDADQIDQWNAIAPTLEPDPKAIKALDVVHPTLESIKVRAIVVAEIVPLTHEGGGRFTAQIGVSEYKAAPKQNATASPNGAGTNERTHALYGDGQGATGTTTTAADEQEKQIAALLGEAKKP